MPTTDVIDEAIAKNPILFPMAMGVLLAGPVAALLLWRWEPIAICTVGWFVLVIVVGSINGYRAARSRR